MDLGQAEKDPGEGEEVAVVTCSICLDPVTSSGDRSTVRLQCGHQFHLDCIGSAFNAKGVMQCPNCRKVEKGNWFYANGPHSLPDVSIDEWTHEDLYNLSVSGMTYGVHWCPFGRLARIPSTLEASSSIHSLVPPYLRAQGSIHQHDQYHNLQSAHGSLMTSMPQVGGLRSLGPPRQSLPDQAGYFVFPPTVTPGQSALGGESIGRHHFYAWESDRFAPFPFVPVHMESSGWRPYLQPTSRGRSVPVHLARPQS